MIIQPKIWGFICTTAHPLGCERNVRDQIERARQRVATGGGGPRNVLVIGASTGYGLAARITAAFGYGAATLGVFLEKPASATRTASAGWYNSAAVHQYAGHAGLACVSINADAFAAATRACAIDAIQRQLGSQVDLVIYSLAAPLRRLPDGSTARTALKPIDATFIAKTIDTDRDAVTELTVPPASDTEIRDTLAVMGGENWASWLSTLADSGVLAENATTVAYSYIGPEITWPIYWHGTIGRAKQHLEATARELRAQHAARGLRAHVAIMKSAVTQASAAIPAMPLYLSVMQRILRTRKLDEDCLAQQQRLFRDFLYRADGQAPPADAHDRWRLDDRELRADVQQACLELWPQLTTQNLRELTDYAHYQREFLQLFGFARSDVDYQEDVELRRDFACLRCD
ncbi:MAG: trans-2-enoyl-CoA reductase family protein [Gammaproteobacteria bacterium]|nr:trans-2-enoyl-CoA reductase family protein [Gammaproteobacteria bacterium]MDE1983065.1 trans-2-enoyl-CoA reductase family protein [Gammaproteobacteria bacterium]MDE2108183.1 trans-2-enoyl-CoA reductase family protein [Gammaproteobacteria bacterium]MDE2460909.1 trans-2-enoyl-CoA reductase family protein [Gammaproteobacteria bacterium]